LVTTQSVGDGAMVKVSRYLGKAFDAFWRRTLVELPASTDVNRLA
jgi:hypothetical protein